MTTLLLVHGRAQASPADVAMDPRRLAAYVEAKKREWLGGLSQGLIRAGLPPITDAVFPFYGNDFQRRIQEYEQGGGRRPELELGMLPDDQRQAQGQALLDTKTAALNDLLLRLDFDPAREMSYTDPALAEEIEQRGVAAGEELGWGDILTVPVLRSGLDFLARKTGVPALIIEEFLTDVAYYLELPRMRDAVLRIVRDALEQSLPGGGPVVVVGHSLGTVVGYDLLTTLDATYEVRQFVTAGSPLGFPVVEKNLLGKQQGHQPVVPAAVPREPGGWVNAYDVRDFVAMMHPLGPEYTAAVPGQVADEQTFNSSAPHSIADYLCDPDVAGPIGRAMG